MTDQTVTVTLPLNVARRFAEWLKPFTPDSGLVTVAEQRIRKALPPVWEEGTVAWVTDFGKGAQRQTSLCERRDGKWVATLDVDGATCEWLSDYEVTHVEPLRVLGDDEIAVKRVPEVTALRMREVADARSGWHWAAPVCSAYADGLDAKECAR